MCGAAYTVNAQANCPSKEAPEKLLAKAFLDDLGVKIEPQALRIFIRWRWDRIKVLAHSIHEEDADSQGSSA